MKQPAQASTHAVRPAASLEGVNAYRRQQQGPPIDLKLDLNEGRRPHPSVSAALAAINPEALRLYPDAREFEALLAGRCGVDPSRVLVTNGGDDAIDRVCRVVLEPGRNAVLTTPTFEMIGRSVDLCGGVRREVEWHGGGLPFGDMLGHIDESTGLVAVVTPNNPTGAVASLKDLRRLAEAAPHAILMVDLAYVEFAESDPTEALLEIPNAVMIRTLSKAWGLAGARVGYALASEPIVEWLRAAGGPFAVGGASLAAATAALHGPAPEEYIMQIKDERSSLIDVLSKHSVEAQPSEGNYVLARMSQPERFRGALAGLGIAVRSFPGKAGLEDAVRITCPGDAEEFERLAHAVQVALAPQAMLFDMDGVLADVSGSYRVATIETAATYGVTITRDEIRKYKARGNANNDWALTKEMLAAHGVEADYDEVVERFEALYQGTDGKPGLKDSEKLLISREQLKALAARMPLAVVTGRPHEDADLFLEEHGIADLFSAVVGLGDGPVKPDPWPIREAMRQLGVTRAWMIGDTPDDARSARAAGAVPVGVPAPMEPWDIAHEMLTNGGCGIIIEKTPDLTELLP